MAQNWNAYREGLNASIEADSDVAKAENPYPAGTHSWQCWHAGWNSHFEKD